MSTRTLPFGTWPSPIDAASVAGAALKLAYPRFDGATLYWQEGRPLEKGRTALMRCDARGTIGEALPPEFSVRTRVHEYGGCAYAVCDGAIVFVNDRDQQLWLARAGGAPRPLTRVEGMRFAEPMFDTKHDRVIAVAEDHRAGDRAPDNLLVAVPLGGGELTDLANGHHFYASAALSADGKRIAFLAWDAPQMPWDGTTLWVADVRGDGSLGPPQRVAGGADESVFQPGWLDDGTLLFVSDRSGYWNLYAHDGRDARNVWPVDAECGRPLWQLGMTSYAVIGAREVALVALRDGRAALHVLDVDRGHRYRVMVDASDLQFPVASATGEIACLAGSEHSVSAIALVDPRDARYSCVRLASELALDAACVSIPEAVSFPTGGGMYAHGFLWRPRHPDRDGPADARPPLIIHVHGGPTSMRTEALSLDTLYWTSRGFAYFELNHRGSAGYGRAFREALKGHWGEVDVDDAVAAATFLIERGDADARRLIITGGSAGGYTVLRALCTTQTFAAAACYFGVGDLRKLDQGTHKFEAHYLAPLIGGTARYDELSPLNHAARIHTPVIFFQGLDDKVVPPEQTRLMVEAVRANGVATDALYFEGEGHGFRASQTLQRCLEAELRFYTQVFDLSSTSP